MLLKTDSKGLDEKDFGNLRKDVEGTLKNRENYLPNKNSFFCLLCFFVFIFIRYEGDVDLNCDECNRLKDSHSTQ